MLIIYLKLPLTDINLTEESVHDVAREQKDINMAVLIATHLTKKVGLKTQPQCLLSVNLNYFSDPLLWSEARAVKLEQINLLLWATIMSLDFIRVGDKELSPGQKPVDGCQRFSFIILMTGSLLWDEILFYGADTKQESVNFKFQSNWWLIRLKFLGKLILKIEKKCFMNIWKHLDRERYHFINLLFWITLFLLKSEGGKNTSETSDKTWVSMTFNIPHL